MKFTLNKRKNDLKDFLFFWVKIMSSGWMLQIQEFRTGSTRQNMETVHAKEESKRLRAQLTEIRDKLSELEARVSTILS